MLFRSEVLKNPDGSIDRSEQDITIGSKQDIEHDPDIDEDDETIYLRHKSSVDVNDGNDGYKCDDNDLADAPCIDNRRPKRAQYYGGDF